MKARAAYKVVGTTWDGVDVLEPKTRSKNFTRSDVKRALARALNPNSFTMLEKPEPSWHCRIGRFVLKPGVTMRCDFACWSFGCADCPD